MKQLSVITISSFVDLITNSSSELFVCDTKKSLKAVKGIIEKIITNYYEEQDLPVPEIWGNIFREPYFAESDFNLDTYPDKRDIQIVRDYNFFDEDERQIQRKTNEKFPEPLSIKGKTWEEKAKDPVYQKWSKESNEYRIKESQFIWDERDAARERINKFFGGDNDVNISYDIKIKKGNIMLESASDNSVPYECWDRINSILGAQNYHLG